MTDPQHVNRLVEQGRRRAEDHLAELEAIYTRLLRAAGRGAATSFEAQAITAAVNPWNPPTDDLVNGEALAEDAAAAVAPVYRRILKAVSPAADLGIAFDVQHPASQALLAGVSARLGALGEAIRRQVDETIRDGHANGWSVDKTARAIRAKVDDVTPGRAAMLARTDLNALSNGASVDAARAVGVETKTWLATEDERTRETHADADGQTVPIDQPFTVGGEQADFPGDPDLSDEESINCRCTVIYGEPLTAAATAEGGDMDDILTAAASGDTGLPLSDRDRAWDAGEATGRLKKWASSDGSGDPDTIDYAKLARGYFWRDAAGDSSPAIGDLKLPFADIVGGTLTAVWRGVTAGAQRLSSTKGVDEGAVQKKMGAYYRKAAAQFKDDSIRPPWETVKASAELEQLEDSELDLLAARIQAVRADRAMASLPQFTIIAAAAGEATRWIAPAIAVENQPTEDGRILLPDSVTWRDGVLPLGIMLDTPHGDLSSAPVCGGIDTLRRVGDVIAASGYFNDTSDDETLASNARMAIDAIHSRSVTGVSVDLMVIRDDLVFWPDTEPLDDAGEDELPPEVGEDLAYPAEVEVVAPIIEEPDGRYLYAVVEGVIGGACIVPVPAIANASIAVVAAAGPFELWRSTRPLFLPCGCDETTIPASLVAAVAPLAPPADWFVDPALDKPTPLTVTPDGRVYGHVALWNTCHEGFPGRCVTAPRSRTAYRKFHNGALTLGDGTELPVGKLTLAAGHARTQGITPEQAVAHYDNTATVAAFVRAGDDKHGIWVAGALRSDLPPERVRDLKANPLSGDWRNGEMIAAHAVVDPGFPVLRASGLGDLLDDEPEEAGPLARFRPARRKTAAAA